MKHDITAKSKRIYWTEDEWRKLAESVWIMRKGDPVSALTILANKAVQQLPPHRRRTLSRQTIDPLVKHLQAIREELESEAAAAQRLRDTLNTYQRESCSREKVLNSLTDRDILVLFGKRFLSILGCLVETNLLPSNVPCTEPEPEPEPEPVRRPKVVVYGLRGAQRHHIQEKVPEAQIIEGRDGELVQADVRIFWTDFATHANWDKVSKHVIPYTGGLTGMVSLIKEELEAC